MSSDSTPADSAEPVSPPAPRPRRPIDAFNASTPPTLIAMASFTWRALVVGAGLLVVLYLLNLAIPVVMALFFSLIVTALAGPVVRWLSSVMPRPLAVVVSLVSMAVAGLVLLGVIVRSIAQEWPSLVNAIEQGFGQIEQWLRTGPLQWSDNQINDAVASATKAAEGYAATLLSSLGGVFDFITAASVFLFATFFFLSDGRRLWEWALSWLPERVRREADDAGQLGWQTLSGYTRGIILVALADGFLVFIGLEILGIPLAPVLAVVVFFGALIPVIGAPVATLLAAVVALATEGPVKALLVVGLTVLVGSFDGDILQPLIMGRAVSLHPLAIVSLIAVGGIAFGLVGALIAVPVGATAYVLAKYLTGRTPPPGTEPPPPPHGSRWHDGRRHWWQRWQRGTGMQGAAPPG